MLPQANTQEAVTLVEQVDEDHGRFLLQQMLRIRRFEEKCVELYGATKIRGFLHLYDGEEAVAVGVIQALWPEDAVVATYREHGQALARGMSMTAAMAELYGKQEGCARGRGGSMHFFDAATRFYGGNAVVGGGLPIAAGLALADKMQNRPCVTCCFFGDGAVQEGEFHECMNLASLWQLPVLFVCENNQYAMGVPLYLSDPAPELVKKACAYEMAAAAVDGMDVLAVEAAAKEAADYVRSGQGPYFLECRTYRFRAHSMFDAELYRTREEVEQWKQRDPIRLLSRVLQEQGLLDEGDLKQLERDVAAEIEEAVAFAEAGTWEPLADLERFVYSERSVA
jgi:pyruvate dehydrogenase E1 component alpha subunit/2-oxoisovalerate dehydrogenase E1 component